MGGVKRWYEDCACKGFVPVSEECVDGLHCLRDDEGMPWIEVIDGGEDGQGISMATARRLISIGAADDEIAMFVECFGDMCPLPKPAPTYTLADHLSELRYYARNVWPARLWAWGFVAAASMIATGARWVGLRRIATAAIWWAYDIADHDPADATWETIMRFAPWAWTAEERFRPEDGQL